MAIAITVLQDRIKIDKLEAQRFVHKIIIKKFAWLQNLSTHSDMYIYYGPHTSQKVYSLSSANRIFNLVVKLIFLSHIN